MAFPVTIFPLNQIFPEKGGFFRWKCSLKPTPTPQPAPAPRGAKFLHHPRAVALRRHGCRAAAAAEKGAHRCETDATVAVGLLGGWPHES